MMDFGNGTQFCAWAEEHSYWRGARPPSPVRRRVPGRPTTPTRTPHSPRKAAKLEKRKVASPPVKMPGVRSTWFYVRNNRPKREYFRWENRSKLRRLSALTSKSLPTHVQTEISCSQASSSWADSQQSTSSSSQFTRLFSQSTVAESQATTVSRDSQYFSSESQDKDRSFFH
ncbi:hypothetical protein M3Y99_01512800 [Aphelenchoides fujianensis]|nr:hypothetical protein M3Y99_01512800 [Aphelenchoides fujianensis]